MQACQTERSNDRAEFEIERLLFRRCSEALIEEGPHFFSLVLNFGIFRKVVKLAGILIHVVEFLFATAIAHVGPVFSAETVVTIDK